MRQKIAARYTLSVIVLALFTLLPQHTSHAATLTVSGSCTLALAIAEANTPGASGGVCDPGSPGVDVISLTHTVTLSAVDNNTQGLNGLPAITSEIIILGNGFSIRRLPSAPSFRLFLVSGGFFGNGDLTLDNVTLRDGDIDIGTDCFLAVEQCGGAILNYSGIVTLRNDSHLLNNTAYGGGAIFNAGGEVEITDTTFTGNTATSYGGGITNTSGATVTIHTSTFTGNEAEEGGGVIHNQGELFIDDSTFTDNHVTGTPPFGGGGGAMYNTTFNGDVEITNSTFSSNSAFRGGALSNYNASDILLINSTITNNRSTGIFGGGGGIWSDNNAYLEVRDSRITNNQAEQFGSDGGGISAGDGGLNSELILVNTLVSNNTSDGDGGGIFMYSSNGAVISNIINSTISDNSATGDGGGIYKNGISPVNIIGSVITDNTVPSPNGNGGGLFFDNPTANAHNHTITNTTISDNRAGEGGGVYSDAFTGTIAITNTTIANNRVITNGAVGEGGAGVSNQHGNITITNSTISGNRVENNGGTLSGSGAAIHHGNGGAVTITHSTLANNASRDGGGIRAQAAVTLTNSILMNTAVNGPNCNPGFAITDGGNNFVDDDTNCPAGFTLSNTINLDALADNGGPTQTHALLPGSAAIDAAGACGLGTDQRGVGRDATCDSGAYENSVVLPVVTFDTATSSMDENPGGATSIQITLDNSSGNITNGSVDIYVSITGSASDGGNDYTRTTTLPLTFTGGSWPAPGASETLTVDLNVLNDFFLEGDETVILTLTDMGIVGPAELGTITQHTLTIIDNTSNLAVQHQVVLTTDVNGDNRFDPGDVVTYTTILSNNGPFDAVDITVENLLSNFLDLPSATVLATTGVYDVATSEWSQDGAGSGNGFVLGAFQTETLTIEVPILPNTSGRNIASTARISEAFLPGAADPVAHDNSAVTHFRVGSPVTDNDNNDGGDRDSDNPDIVVFDPAISKLGFLLPGQVGVTGEQLEWVITVSNPSSTPGINVVITDHLNDGLRIDKVETTTGTAHTNGQTVTVTIPLLDPGAQVTFSIFTTVLDGAEVQNTACVQADNQPDEECATALPITSLPRTGEAPWWRDLLLASLALLVIGGLLVRGNWQSFLKNP